MELSHVKEGNILLFGF